MNMQTNPFDKARRENLAAMGADEIPCPRCGGDGVMIEGPQELSRCYVCREKPGVVPAADYEFCDCGPDHGLSVTGSHDPDCAGCK
jgi:hypothetical protein